MSGSAFAVTHHAFSSGAGRTADRNRSHWSTSKTPSYTKSVSWQHHPVREYVVRLRRLGNHLHEQNISLDPLQDGFLDEILAPWLPTTSTNNYRIALRKYQHYQRQTCTGLVQKSSSLPASDIY